MVSLSRGNAPSCGSIQARAVLSMRLAAFSPAPLIREVVDKWAGNGVGLPGIMRGLVAGDSAGKFGEPLARGFLRLIEGEHVHTVSLNNIIGRAERFESPALFARVTPGDPRAALGARLRGVARGQRGRLVLAAELDEELDELGQRRQVGIAQAVVVHPPQLLLERGDRLGQRAATPREVALGIDYWFAPSIVWQTEVDFELPHAGGTMYSFNGGDTATGSPVGATTNDQAILTQFAIGF